jgi:hypothetical protein
MIDQRRIRFSTIDGLRRSDLPLACDIWADDVYRAPWGTRETMKIAAFLVRYITDGLPPTSATLGSLELRTQLGREEAKQALKILHLYRAVEAYSIDRNELRVAMRLSDLQRGIVLETSERLAQMSARRAADGALREERWLPTTASAALDDQDELDPAQA